VSKILELLQIHARVYFERICSNAITGILLIP
jgi:hypothetical protein